MRRKSARLAESLLTEGVWTDRLRRMMGRRDPEGRGQPQRQQRQVASPKLPPKYSLGHDEDIKMAAKSGFTAHSYAEDNGHHPALWKAVQGTPYESMYRKLFPDLNLS